MSNKFMAVISTVVAATLCFSATSAFAVDNKVHVIRECVGYDDEGNEVATLTPDYYPAEESEEFADGDVGVKVWLQDMTSGQDYTVNISTRCLESHEGLVTFY